MAAGNQHLETVPRTPPHVRVQLLSQARYLSGARDLVAAIAKRYGFEDQVSGQMALAIDEALCNVLRHGYSGADDKPIWLSIWPLCETTGQPAGGIRIVIEDEARQVDPSVIKGRDLAEIRPGGLGVYIIQQVMDHARYEKRSGAQGGMRLVMAKAVAPATEKSGAACETTASRG